MALTEEAYLRWLERDRRLFVWCFQHVGGRTAEEAEATALKVYYYEPPEREYRWIVFHESPWYWAMRWLFADHPSTPPEYREPTAGYERERQREIG